jgi:hypothetical protein
VQRSTSPDDYELREEYDLAEMTVVAKGRYAPQRRAGKNVVLLDDDLVTAFPTDEAVNEALRLVIRISEVRAKYSTEAPES